tara:strand:+ start:249 stop:512 length:264 start_codon:yes stop_codon:yes gene_type:complete
MNTEIKDFLKEILDKLENNQLNDDQLAKIGQFRISYLYENQNENDIEYSQDELVKFLSLGWYIYTQLINNENIQDDQTNNDFIEEVE